MQMVEKFMTRYDDFSNMELISSFRKFIPIEACIADDKKLSDLELATLRRFSAAYEKGCHDGYRKGLENNEAFKKVLHEIKNKSCTTPIIMNTDTVSAQYLSLKTLWIRFFSELIKRAKSRTIFLRRE